MQTEHVYQSYSTILSEIIKNNDLTTAKAFLTGLYPSMSDYNQEEFSGLIFTNVMSKGSLDMQLLFIDTFGMSSGAAKGYINSCLHDKNKDRSLISTVAKYIGENYGAELAGAFIMGDVEIAETLFLSNSEKRPVISNQNGWTLIDDQRIDNKSEIMAEINSSQLRRLTEIIDSAGMNFIIDHDYRVLGTSSLQNSKFSTSSPVYSGSFPTIEFGVINHPELFLAFKEQSSKTAFPGVFSKIPCWVRPGTFENSEKVSVYSTRQVLTSRDVNRNVVSVTPLSELVRSFHNDLTPLSLDRGVLEFQLEHTHFEMEESGYKSASKVKGSSSNLLKEIVPLDVISGFGHPPGYLLAVVDIELLEGIPISSPSSDELKLASEFAKGFFPATVLSNAYNSHDWDVMNDGLVGFDSYDGLEAFQALRNPLLRDHLIEFIPESLWLALYKKCSYKMSADTILDAKDTFGFDDSISKITLNTKSICRLYESGFKLFNSGENCEFDAHPARGESRDVNSYVYYIRMGGWPSTLPKPKSVQEGISFAIRKKNDPIYDLYLLSVGAEEVIKAAKTPAQFDHIYHVFPRGDLTPFLKLMPRSLKGKHLEDDLGM